MVPYPPRYEALSRFYRQSVRLDSMIKRRVLGSAVEASSVVVILLFFSMREGTEYL